MRTKFLKYGKRLNGYDHQSEYLEVSMEIGPQDDPGEVVRRAKAFVHEKLREKVDESAPTLKAPVGEIAVPTV